MRTQKQIASSGFLAVVIGLSFAVLGCTAEKKEVSLKFADCPAAVQQTIIAHAGGVQFPEVSMETKKEGRVIYEAKGKNADGRKIEIKVASDGRLVEFESKDND